jgi:hypothetical protein
MTSKVAVTTSGTRITLWPGVAGVAERLMRSRVASRADAGDGRQRILAFRRGDEPSAPSSTCFACVRTYDEKP